VPILLSHTLEEFCKSASLYFDVASVISFTTLASICTHYRCK